MSGDDDLQFKQLEKRAKALTKIVKAEGVTLI
jgi:hypothetical protein